MKLFIVVALFVAAAAAAPADKDVETVYFDVDNIGVEKYGYKWQTSDGKTAEEQGQVENIGSEKEALKVRGSFSYVGNDGVTYSVTYTADEFGFKPQGAHLPVPPQ